MAPYAQKMEFKSLLASNLMMVLLGIRVTNKIGIKIVQWIYVVMES